MDLHDKIDLLLQLQEMLFSLDEESIESFINFLESEELLLEYLSALIHHTLLAVDYRPKTIKILVEITKTLIQMFPETNFVSIILTQIKTSKPSNSRLYFLYKCIEIGLIQEECIIPLVNTNEYFVWFAPIVEKYNIDKFNHFKQQKDEDMFIHIIDELMQNSWEKHKLYASNGVNHHEITQIIRNDDLEGLKKVDKACLLSRIPWSPFESIDLLNHGCTFLQYSAFYKSLKCFNFILSQGASLNSTDFAGNTALQFLIASDISNLIVDALSHSYNVMPALLFASLFHQNHICEFILQQNKNINVNHLFLSSVASNNISLILQCIDNNIDINCCNSVGETALIIAAANNHTEIVELLLEQPMIDINHVDKFGRNALINAISANSLEIIKILVKDNRIDINSTDISSFLTERGF
ncbi:hypothetical protein TRFO_01592 [Tritrichomonas foetus]|uniref:Uncharacterized protein n=1 Tax=Tritrichomonas foetus TaxID=1144522 RepID=A0A1J4JXI4_9EUKA|nr:hypothetical protein TRFO_01592 [Tritrichomonas foetus]|eukprot:OHT03863.1 hypothetical protein TRFO_01592 [Tritrichomonas foetus]